MKIKKGDTVKIIAGNDKGKTGKILAVFPQEGRIAVEGINMKKKHVRPRQAGKKGEVVLMPVPFSVSRAMRVCPKCGKPARTGSVKVEQVKHRVCRKCGERI